MPKYLGKTEVNDSIATYKVVNDLVGTLTGLDGAFLSHNDLIDKETPNAHPISAITGLQDALDNVVVDIQPLTITVNGESTSFDGSEEKTIQISVPGIPTLEELGGVSQNEFNQLNYALANEPGGIAIEASKVTNSLTISHNNSSIVYDGSASKSITITQPDLSGYVETTRTINGKALDENIILTAEELGAVKVYGSGTEDIGEGAELPTGQLYFIYE